MALPLGAVQILAVSLTAFALSAIALALRLWARAIKKKPLSPSDYMVIFAMVNSMAKIALFFAVVFNGGVGVHLGELLSTNPAAFSLFVKLFVPAQLLWAAANTCNKISILLLYTELFPVTKLIILCRICIAVSAAYFLSVFLEAFLLCTPAAYNWDKSIPDGVCRNQDLADLLSGITNLIIDAIVVILPMPQLFVLQMSLTKRIGIAAMFSLGALICIISLLRVLWLHDWDRTDLTYTVPPGIIYSILEPALGVVNACLPTIMPAISKIRHLKADNKSTSKSVFSRPSDWENSYRRGPVAHMFQPLDDGFPLTSIRIGSSTNFVPEEPVHNEAAITTEGAVNRGVERGF